MQNAPPAGYIWDPHLELGEETANLTQLVWPNFIVDPSDIPEPELTFEISMEKLVQRIPVWGLRRESDRRLVASASAALIQLDNSAAQLPDDGWRFSMRALGLDLEPNSLCLLAANVDPEFQRLGFARLLIARAKEIARERGLATVTGPVRPVAKDRLPHLSMAAYAATKTEDGRPFDPWLRLHTSEGAEILNICSDSVRIHGTLAKWRAWTGLPLDRDGEHIIPGGLAPLQVSLERNFGFYREPNIWVRYKV